MRQAAAALGCVLAAALAGCAAKETPRGTPERPPAEQVPPPQTKPAEPASEGPPRAVAPRISTAVRTALRHELGQLRAEGVRASVAIAALGGGPITTLGPSAPLHGWSTTKVPVVVALLKARRAGRLPGGKELTTVELTAIARAIQASDNAAIGTLFDELTVSLGGERAATAAVERTLRLAGDHRTHVPSRRTRSPSYAITSFGQTRWTLSEMARFYRAMANGCLTTPSGTRRLLSALRDVEPVQQWGAYEARWPAGAQVAVKGGWGQAADRPDAPYEVLQAAVVSRGGRGLVLTMATSGPGTGWPAATSRLTRLASAAAGALHALPRDGAGRRCADGSV